MLFTGMTTPVSSSFAPFTVVFSAVKEWNCTFIKLVCITGEVLHIGEFDNTTFELVFDRQIDGCEEVIEAVSDADVRRIVVELGIRGRLDALIEWARE